MHADAFLNEADGLLDLDVKPALYEETEYLWATFPHRARTIENYRRLLQVLLTQSVDYCWYAGYARYESELEVDNDDTLYSFKRGAADFEVRFIYVQYFGHVLMRIPNLLRLRSRRVVNHPGRYTQGLRITRCKKAMVGFINQMSKDVAKEITNGVSFKIMVNSVLRTKAYQNSLASLGYIAPRHSAHLAGYAVDVEKLWYEKHDRAAHEAIVKTLGELFELGVVNLIEEETHWHVCLNPDHIPYYETLAQECVRKRF